MSFNFDKKNKGGQRGKRKGQGRYFRFGRKRAPAELERQNIYCICPECGHSVPHQPGLPCFEIRCSQCGSKMARRF